MVLLLIIGINKVILASGKNKQSMKAFGISAGIFLAVAFFADAVLAQDTKDSAGILNGLSATVSNEFSYDDNILRQQDNRTASRVWMINPKLNYKLKAAGGSYSLSYDINHTDYLDSQQDTVTSQSLGAVMEQKINNSNKFSITGAYNSGYEARGVGFNEGSNALTLSKPTSLVTKALSGKYQLGADNARLRFIGTLGHQATSRDSGVIVDNSRDYHEDSLGAEVEYKVGSRTDLVAEWRDQMTTYSRTPVTAGGTEIPLDSEETEYLVGLDLAATAKTTGRLRVGTTKREFKWKPAQWADAQAAATSNAQATDTPVTPAIIFPTDPGTDFYWEVAAVWAPRTYSHFELNARTSTREALGVGNFIRSKDYMLQWAHQWNKRVRSSIDFSIGTDEYVGASRVDDRTSYNLRLEYDLGDLLNLGFGYRYQDLQSSVGTVAYDKSIYYLFVNYRNKKGI